MEVVNVFPGSRYNFCYYDMETGCYKKMTGKCNQVSKCSLWFKQVRVLADDDVCLCEKKDELDEYIEINTLEVPIFNLFSIEKVEDRGAPPKEREETVVGVLGISAEVIQSVVIRLRIFDDGRVCQETIPVDMIAGNYYRIVFTRTEFENPVTYELEGRLVGIDLIDQPGPGCGNNFVREEPPKCGCNCPGKEIVGGNNMVYTNDHFFSLDKNSEIGYRVVFKFDTSGTFYGVTDYVMLKDVRDVEDVTANYNQSSDYEEFPEVDDGPDDGCIEPPHRPHPRPGCDCRC